MTDKENTPICMAPFYGISIKADESQGFRMKQCCESSLRYSDTHFTSNDLSPQSFFQSELMDEIRLSLKSGKFHDSCISCSYMNKIGINTTQHKYQRTFDQISQLRNGGGVPELNFLDVRLSNKCNLKCRMCSPENSSAIAQELYPDRKSLIEVHNYNELISNIDFSKLYFLKISGGEPFIMDETVDLLSNKLCSDLTLVILTNGQYLKDEILNALSVLKVKRIHFQVSMDGTSDYLEYIRVGSRWNTIISNIKRLDKINPSCEVTVGVTHVPQLWNAFDIPDFINWAQGFTELNKNKNTYYPKIFYSNVVQDYLSIENLDPSDKKDINDSITLLGKKMGAKDYDLFITPIQKMLNGERKADLSLFKKETFAYDKRYSTSLVELDNRYEKYLS